MFEFFRKTPPPAPEQINEHGQVTDEKILNSNRIKFGIGTILYQSEETGIGPVPTAIIRALGGNALHLGVFGAINSINSIFQWLGTLLLKIFNSNRKAMIASMMIGLSVSLLIVLSILLSCNPIFKPFSLWAYLILTLTLAIVGGMQWNIETSWIGDLVPKNKLGWFASMKWIIGVFGILCFMLFFARLSDWSPTLPAYASIYMIFAVSFIGAIFLYRTTTDRPPKNANFLSSGATHHDRLNYKSLPLWCYIAFYSLWSGGRTVMFAFAAAYLIDQFNFSLTKIAIIFALQYVISMGVLAIMGKHTDKSGHRIPLIFVSGGVACCMLLWVSSAWFGVVPIIIYYIINGAAGHTHTMLALNFGLEIIPDKGRSGYLAFSRFFIGCVSTTLTIVGGKILQMLHGWHYTLLGTQLNHYHLLFTVCSCFTFCCVIPLLIVGKRTVQEG